MEKIQAALEKARSRRASGEPSADVQPAGRPQKTRRGGKTSLWTNLKEIELSGKALAELTFSKKRVAEDVKKTVQSAIANAENNHGLDVDDLIVAEAWVGKNLTLKRGRPRARGRFCKILKPFAQITIKVRQVEEQA